MTEERVRMMKRVHSAIAAAALVALAAQGSFGTPRLVAPRDGESVCLTSDMRREFLAFDAATRRAKFLDKEWRHAAKKHGSMPLPVVLKWSGDAPADGFRLVVRRAGSGKPVMDERVKANEYKLWNLEIARKYEWSVSDGESTASGKFETAALPPRDMKIDDVQNFRDLGGWVGLDGRRVKQGMVFRSQGLNSNANFYLSTKETLKLYKDGKLEERFGAEGAKMKERIDKEKGNLSFDEKAPYLRKMLKRDDPKPGKVRLTPDASKYLLETIGMKTDIDLRGPDEVWGMTQSPLGPTVKWLNYSSSSYGGMGRPAGKEAFKKVFAVFLDERNYPIDIHCIGGADRTGSDCFVINALLGVSDDDLAKDWEITCFEYEDQNFGHVHRFDHLLRVFNSYPGATMREKCEAYVKEIGFTDADIAKLRSIMLEPKP